MSVLRVIADVFFQRRHIRLSVDAEDGIIQADDADVEVVVLVDGKAGIVLQIIECQHFLDGKYPKVAARVRQQLETGWEQTLPLLEQAMDAGPCAACRYRFCSG